jgi:diguanylate cyclase (GGDEF)-like protein
VRAEAGRRLFRSLAVRVSFFVFAAALTSALAVAGTSARSLRGFLRSKVEQRIPGALLQVRDQLELWYGQRSLDVEVFARSATVVDGLARVARSGPGVAGSHDRAEVERYLGYVLGGLQQYTSIFVLDARGRLLLAAGALPDLPEAALKQLAAADRTRMSDLLVARDGQRLQVVSSPVGGHDERGPYTLHAVMPLETLEEQLRRIVPPTEGRLLVFDRSGRLAASSNSSQGTEPLPAALASATPPAVHDYVAPDGVRVVGSAAAFPRLGWTLVLEEGYEGAFAPIASILGRTVALNLGIVLVLSLGAFVAVAWLVRPLHVLSDWATARLRGETSTELPIVKRTDELGVLARSFTELVHGLQRANEHLEQLAITDGLTKIANHRHFQDELARHVRRAERLGSPLALILIDIDGFKALNDCHGHVVGDAVLTRLAALLLEVTRDHDVVARYGGEEFAVLSPDTECDEAIALAEGIRLAISGHAFEVDASAAALPITVSVGVALFHGDAKGFFQEADHALYDAKRQGKDCVVLFEP